MPQPTVDVNATFQPADRLILFDEGDDRVNWTVIVQRRADVVGKLCVNITVEAVNSVGDASRAPAQVGIDGLPYSIAEDDAEETKTSDDDIVEFRFNVSLAGRRLGRGLVTVTAHDYSNSSTQNNSYLVKCCNILTLGNM